ncbi:MAG: type VI secretion system tip protein TssI/VgrG [Pseudomonadota bacterium]
MIGTRSARVDSPLGDGVLLFLSMNAREALGRPFSYTVDVLADDDTLDFSKLLGQVMTIELELELLMTREFSGYVTELGLVGQLGRYVRYRVQLSPWLSLLGHTSNSRIFQNQTAPEVIKQIFRDHGYSDFSEALGPHYRKWEYLVQYRESDLHFVSRLMEQEGIYYYFKHHDKKHTLVLADSYSSHEAVPGYEQVPYFPPHEGERRERDHVDGWRTSRQVRAGAFVIRDFDFEKPRLLPTSQLRQPNAHAKAGGELFDYPGEFRDQDEGDVQVRLRLEEQQSDYEVARGSSNARGLSTGALFSLTDFPREDQNKEYLITEAQYDLRVNDYQSLDQGDGSQVYRCEFKAIDSRTPFRAPRTTKKPVVEGPQTAIVAGDPKQEILTDQYGRIKVRFHWDRADKTKDDGCCWVRVAQIWAGAAFGGIHIPRIGQEVVVDFLEGDPDRPIVTGCLYNGDNPPPYELPKNQTQSGIKSRSVLGGTSDNFNEIRFEDKKGDEELHVQAEKDLTTLVKNDQTTDIKHDRSVTISHNDTLSITGDQFIHIHGNLSMTVDGVTDSKNKDASSPIKSSMAVTGAHDMKASDSISLTAPNKITLTVGGSSVTITPGSITLSAGGSQIVLDANVLAASKAGSKIKIDADVTSNSSKGAMSRIDDHFLGQSAAGSKVVLDANAALTSPGDAIITGTNVTMTGQAKTTVAGAAAKVELAAAGATVSGPKVSVAGSAVTEIKGGLVKIN